MNFTAVASIYEKCSWFPLKHEKYLPVNSNLGIETSVAHPHVKKSLSGSGSELWERKGENMHKTYCENNMWNYPRTIFASPFPTDLWTYGSGSKQMRNRIATLPSLKPVQWLSQSQGCGSGWSWPGSNHQEQPDSTLKNNPDSDLTQ